MTPLEVTTVLIKQETWPYIYHTIQSNVTPMVVLTITNTLSLFPLTPSDDCPHPTCSDHGWCVSGTCVCQRGWRGEACDSRDDAALQCLPDCNNHGHFDLESHKCVCDPEWTGAECSTREYHTTH